MTGLPQDLLVSWRLIELERYDCVYCALSIELCKAGRATDEVHFDLDCACRPVEPG